MTRSTFHGTRNFEGQIAHGINHSAKLKTETKKLRVCLDNEQVIFFIDNHLLCKVIPKANSLLRPDAIHLDNLQVFEITLVLEYLKENPSLVVTQVNQSNRAIIQKNEFHTVKHDNSNRFFVEVEATNDYLLISFSFITRRCILSTYSGSVLKEKNYVLSPCMDLSEHD